MVYLHRRVCIRIYMCKSIHQVHHAMVQVERLMVDVVHTGLIYSTTHCSIVLTTYY